MLSLFIPQDLRDIPNYPRYWFSQFVSFMANQVLMMAFGWHVYAITQSALSLGYIGLMLFAPQMLLVLVVGHVADRYDRRTIVMITQTLECMVAGSLALASFYDVQSEQLIFFAAFCIGAIRAFQGPALQAMLPGLIPLNSLPKAIALGSASRQFATIAGPALGGLLFFGGNTFVYTASALLFALAFGAMLRIRYQPHEEPRRPVNWETIFAGVKFIWRRPVILGAISLDLFSVLIGSATALFPIYAEHILNTGSWGLGLLRAGPAVGALILAIYIARFPLKEKVGRTMFIGVAVFGVTTIIFGLSEWFWLSFTMLIVMGAADMISVVVRSSLVQLQTPDDMRGRVGAVNSIFIGASNQLGDFESGVVAEFFGTVPAVVAGGVGTLLVVGLWIKMFPSLYHWDRLTANEPPGENSATSPAHPTKNP